MYRLDGASGPAEIFRATRDAMAQVAPGEAPQPYCVNYYHVGDGMIGVIGKPQDLVFFIVIE